MRLTDLIGSDETSVYGGIEPGTSEVTGITCDSRLVEPGYLFAALPGARADGRTFIAEAAARGASAILAPDDVRPNEAGGLPLVTDPNPRRRYALLAARFYGAQPEYVAAVTGTNGKTSVASFTRQIWVALDRPAASAGTLGIQAVAPDGAFELDGSLTTPDPADLHRSLAQLAGRGIQRLALEASSHGLDQFRLDGVRIRAAAFTNLTRDHLDYHGTDAAYRDAKLRLFRNLLEADVTAVVNADAAGAAAFADAARERGIRLLQVGEAGDDVRLRSVEPQPDGQRVTLAIAGHEITVDLPLVGMFQAWNVLCAVGLAIASGEDAGAVVATLPRLQGVRGRLERAGALANGAAVYVDYAHTPDALATVLRAVRPHVRGRLHVIFGCGGDRDAGKRPEMGRAAAAHADVVVITDDNPRTEDAAAIRRQTLAGCPDALEIGDRAEAIREGIRDLGPGDVLVVAGKGHEQGQIVGDTVRPFDDAIVVRSAIEELGA